MKEKDDSIFIKHILESINAIEEFSKNINEKELHLNRLKRSAIVKEIEIIGEASKNISTELKKKYNKIPWKDISGTRDIMAHRYFGIDLLVVLKIIKEDIPKLKKQILQIK